MSYDFAIWRRSERTKTAMLADAYDAICDGSDHPAMAPFELGALERALREQFGDLDAVDGPIVCEAGGTAAAKCPRMHYEATTLTTSSVCFRQACKMFARAGIGGRGAAMARV